MKLSQPDPFESRIAHMLRLVVKPPNDDLLLPYFLMRLGEPVHRVLTLHERKWVELNLRYNPLWRKIWKAYERSWGTRVPMGKPRVLETRASFPRPSIARGGLVGFCGSLLILVVGTVAMSSLGLNHQAQSSVGSESLIGSKSLYFGDGRARSIELDSNPLSTWMYYLSKADRRRRGGVRDTESLIRVSAALTSVHESAGDSFVKSNAAYWLGVVHRELQDGCVASEWFRIALSERVADFRLEAMEGLTSSAKDCAASAVGYLP